MPKTLRHQIFVERLEWKSFAEAAAEA